MSRDNASNLLYKHVFSIFMAALVVSRGSLKKFRWALRNFVFQGAMMAKCCYLFGCIALFFVLVIILDGFGSLANLSKMKSGEDEAC